MRDGYTYAQVHAPTGPVSFVKVTDPEALRPMLESLIERGMGLIVQETGCEDGGGPALIAVLPLSPEEPNHLRRGREIEARLNGGRFKGPI